MRRTPHASRSATTSHQTRSETARRDFVPGGGPPDATSFESRVAMTVSDTGDGMGGWTDTPDYPPLDNATTANAPPKPAAIARLRLTGRRTASRASDTRDAGSGSSVRTFGGTRLVAWD